MDEDESAWRPGLDPEAVRPAAMQYKLTVTCGDALGSSHGLAPDDDTMCPECARPGRLPPVLQSGVVAGLQPRLVLCCCLPDESMSSNKNSGRTLSYAHFSL